jgi:hypothetical protein
MKAGTETGSLMNHVMTSAKQAEPKVGMGATLCFWTDRKAGTIIKVTRCQVHVQEDTATRTDSGGMTEAQQYTYTPNPEGAVHVFRKTKKGWHSTSGAGLTIGVRRAYHDFSF